MAQRDTNAVLSLLDEVDNDGGPVDVLAMGAIQNVRNSLIKVSLPTHDAEQPPPPPSISYIEVIKGVFKDKS